MTHNKSSQLPAVIEARRHDEFLAQHGMKVWQAPAPYADAAKVRARREQEGR